MAETLEDKALAYIDNENPFVKGRSEIVMRKNWLAEFMTGFHCQQRAEVIDEIVRLCLIHPNFLDPTSSRVLQAVAAEMRKEEADGN